jgi:menaquinone-specific isochorismate synthase
VGSRREESDRQAPDRLIVRTVAFDDPGDLIGWLPEPDALAWIRRGDGLVGWGTAASITLPAGHDRFTAGEKWLREIFDSALVIDHVGVPGSGPVAFGSFTFDPASEGSALVVPRAVLGRRDGLAWLTTIDPQEEAPASRDDAPPPRCGAGVPPRGAAAPQPSQREAAGTQHEAAALMTGRPEWPGQAPLSQPASVVWGDGSLTPLQWEQAVAAAVGTISAGGLRKVVLARDLNATAVGPIDARVLLARLAASYPDCYTFACAGLIGATPELLIRREDRGVRSLVLAGTAPRGRTAADDDALGAALLASAKDLDEHECAVDDVRTALLPLCADLRIEQRPFLLRLANVQHLATWVHGRLSDGESAARSALSLAAALHPTAAVGGTPAEAALELIRELERMDRGRYSGPVGWVDACGNGEWGIALRCAQLDGRRARLFAGCGIVAGSRPAAELAETQAKFRPMQQALEG